MLKSLSLQNFRNYKKRTLEFGNSVIIVGPNTAGKSNLIESIYLLSSGKSFRADKDSQMVLFGNEMGRVKGLVDNNSEETNLEVVVTMGEVGGVPTQFKRFFVNGVARRRVDFIGNLISVLFSPEDLEIVAGSPGIRRNFLDNVLEQTDREYRFALISYVKGIRQRNALLELAKDTHRRREKEFEYWDRLVIENGNILTHKREGYIAYLNQAKKEILKFKIEYDKSIISEPRLIQYQEAETASGVTLVGPHRDDFIATLSIKGDDKPLKSFGSRGQQRLGVLQLKLLELEYIKKIVGSPPLLLLDDVFSELDEGHINLILGIKDNQQTIITTTHEEFVPAKIKNKTEMIELENA